MLPNQIGGHCSHVFCLLVAKTTITEPPNRNTQSPCYIHSDSFISHIGALTTHRPSSAWNYLPIVLAEVTETVGGTAIHILVPETVPCASSALPCHPHHVCRAGVSQ